MFLSDEEKTISDSFVSAGYVIRPAADPLATQTMQDILVALSSAELNNKVQDDPVAKAHWLNNIHEHVSVSELNDFRLKMIAGINARQDFRQLYFRAAKSYLETIVGNELAMQLQVNLSIQMPNDDSSLLPVHADTWSGDSPFEVVTWIPLVDCYATKAMYLLGPEQSQNLLDDFKNAAGRDSETLFQHIKEDVEWLKIQFGEVLVFNQTLPHGNRVNSEAETRWSMNCRFKGVFTPYADKKLGEFFEPITLRAASRLGIEYKLPSVS